MNHLKPLQVKIITSYTFDELEDKINAFLVEIHGSVSEIDVSYKSTYGSNRLSALIAYR